MTWHGSGILDVAVRVGTGAVSLSAGRTLLPANHSPGIRASFRASRASAASAFHAAETVPTSCQRRARCQPKIPLQLLPLSSLMSAVSRCSSPAAGTRGIPLIVSSARHLTMPQSFHSARAHSTTVKISRIRIPPVHPPFGSWLAIPCFRRVSARTSRTSRCSAPSAPAPTCRTDRHIGEQPGRKLHVTDRAFLDGEAFLHQRDRLFRFPEFQLEHVANDDHGSLLGAGWWRRTAGF